jgi:hypothetical protein
MSITTEPKEKDKAKNISHLRIPFSSLALGLATQMQSRFFMHSAQANTNRIPTFNKYCSHCSEF